MSPSSAQDDRRRSPITMPGYREGQPAPNKGMKLPPEPLTAAEVHRLLAACSTRGSAGIRDRALFVLLWRCGLRINEALKLEPRDVDLDAGTVHVRHPKPDRNGVRRPRRVGLDPEACAVIERWLVRRRKLGIGPGKPLFCVISRPTKGKELYASCVRKKLKAVAEQAGIDKRVHPHGLRHTHAFELAMENVPVTLIQKQLGHRSLATTERYVDHLRPAQVIDAMRARTWADDAAAAG